MRIEKIDAVNKKLEYMDIYELYKIMSSNKISDYQKMQFIHNNRTQIHNVMKTKITNSEFLDMMGTRPLIRFRPLKNSYTKWGDKALLAKALGISTAQVPEYIRNVTLAMQDLNQMHKLPLGQMDTIKTYVYRHGTSGEVVAFLDYELKNAKDLQKTLISTLQYQNGSLAEYFVRPIHRMSNKTFLNLFDVIHKNIEKAVKDRIITAEISEKLSQNSLAQLYNIQYNSKFINALKPVKK